MSGKIKMKKRKKIILSTLLLIGFIYFGITGNIKNSLFSQKPISITQIENAQTVEAKVKRVVDGDTLLVEYDGKEEKIRMIGVDTPESVSSDESKNCVEGESASNFTKEQLPEDTIVYLEFDKEKMDPYGRTLAYVWLSDTCNYENYEDFCNYNYGAILLQNTYCDAVYYEPNGKYREWYENLSIE